MKLRTIFGPIFGLALLMSLPALAEIADAPVEVIEAGLVFKNLDGTFLWLDDETIAVSTREEIKESKTESWNRKVLAFDVKTRKAKTIAESGHLVCANATENLISIRHGTSFGPVGVPKDPRIQLYKWDRIKKSLVEVDPESVGLWNQRNCVRTSKTDVKTELFGHMGSNKRYYLSAGHGVLDWRFVYGEASKLAFSGPDSKPRQMDATTDDLDDMLHPPVYLAFAKAYLLKRGSFKTGGEPIDQRGKKVPFLPMVLLTEEGEVQRIPPPSFLISSISEKGTLGEMVQTAAGPVVRIFSGTPETGGGIYLLKGDSAKRIWCTQPKPGSDYEKLLKSTRVPCAAGIDFPLSPNGCKMAFYSKFPKISKWSNVDASELMVIDVCSAQ